MVQEMQRIVAEEGDDGPVCRGCEVDGISEESAEGVMAGKKGHEEELQDVEECVGGEEGADRDLERMLLVLIFVMGKGGGEPCGRGGRLHVHRNSTRIQAPPRTTQSVGRRVLAVFSGLEGRRCLGRADGRRGSMRGSRGAVSRRGNVRR